MIEALACGTPTIATDDQPFTEIGHPETCVFFKKGNAEFVKTLISDFAQNQG
jgi:glycosyltransferase involved in cell wall biosynthesis